MILNGGVMPHVGPLTAGKGLTTLTVLPGQLPASLIGTKLYHAFVVLDPGLVRDPSNVVQILITP